MADLDLSELTAQWLTTGFMLTMAVVIPLTGFLMGRFSTRQVFSIAMTLFTIGTVVCVLAPGFLPLLAGRIVQACGTAIMMPLLMTTVMNLVPPSNHVRVMGNLSIVIALLPITRPCLDGGTRFNTAIMMPLLMTTVMNLVPPSKHGRVMGNISIVIAVAPALGPTISGAILSFAPWRGLFVLVLPIAVIALVVGLRRIENVHEATPQPADALSVVLSVVGFGPLVYGLTGIGGDSGAAATGSSGPGTDALIALGVGVVSLALFVWRQTALQKRDRALLDLRTFAVRNFSVAVVLMVVMMGAMFGTVVLLPIYLQLVLGLSTLTVGAMMLPGGLVMGLAAPAVGRMFDRVGPRPLLTPGLGLVVVGILVMSTVGTDTSPLVIVGGHLVMSCGLALVFTPLLTTALGSLPKSLYPHGSAMVGTVQQVAGAAGGAMLVALMSRIAAGVEADGGSHAQGIAAGTSVAFLVSAVLGVVTIAISLFIRRNPQHGAAPADQPEPELQPEPMAATDADEDSADSVAEQL